MLRARLGYPARGFRRDPSHVHGAARARLLSRWVRRHAVWKHRWHEAERARAASPVAIITSIFGSEAPSAIAVARCESGLDPRAHNPSGAAGLFQLMPSHWQSQGYDPYDAATNTRIARALYDAVGWSAWVCQP